MTELERRVAEWVRAEWEFRLGRRAYSNETQHWLVKAERKLRRELTGKGELDEAKKELKR